MRCDLHLRTRRSVGFWRPVRDAFGMGRLMAMNNEGTVPAVTAPARMLGDGLVESVTARYSRLRASRGASRGASAIAEVAA